MHDVIKARYGAPRGEAQRATRGSLCATKSQVIVAECSAAKEART